VPIVLKSGRFNLLEPSGPVKACNGIALPLLADLIGMSCTKHRVNISKNLFIITAGVNYFISVLALSRDFGCKVSEDKVPTKVA
jgi:hypothetical protein